MTTEKKTTEKKTTGRKPRSGGADYPGVADARDTREDRSFYVARLDGGTWRTLNVAPVANFELGLSGGEISIPGIVYDGNDSELGRPVRIVLAEFEAEALLSDLGRFVEFAKGPKK